MITLIAGRPKSGKSYECVKHHIIPALQSGRKVITNLPLNVDEICNYYGEDKRSLIEIVSYDTTDFRSSAAAFPFSKPEDYIHEWRHPKTKLGPLIVVDEAQFAIPKRQTGQPLRNFFTMHGHYGIDVVLLSQQPSQIDSDVLRLVEIMHRTIKNTALGSKDTYIKKAYDGHRGQEVNKEIRKYDSRYFRFYRAFTQSDEVPELAGASDLKSLREHWSTKGAFLLIPIGLISFVLILYNKFSEEEPTKLHNPASIEYVRPEPAPAPKPKPEEKKTEEKTHPYKTVNFHISGYVQFQSGERKGEFMYQFTASQNGQPVFNLSQYDLIQAGYEIESHGSCAVTIRYGDFVANAICDNPRVKMAGNPLMASN